MKKAVLTAITGNYDDLPEPVEKRPGWDYICYTDNPELKSETWDIRFLENPWNLSVIKLARHIKIQAFDYLPDYDIVLWVDGNQRITGNIDALLEKLNDKSWLAVEHSGRKCIYDEAIAVIRMKKDSPAPVNRQVRKLRDEGFPEYFVLHETGVNIRKNTEEVKAFCRDWWEELYNNSHRDQLSFDYIRWKRGMNLKVINRGERNQYFSQIKRHTNTYEEGIDIVYPYGPSSGWTDNELRYSIRSVIEYFKDLRHIVVIGRKPRWLTNVIFIPAKDDGVKDANIIKKLLIACRDKRVSEQFIYAADDKFMLEDLYFSDLNGWHYGKIMDGDPATSWNALNQKTAARLREIKKPQYDYNKAHAFQPIDKKSFVSIMNRHDWGKEGYLGANLYLNSTTKFKGKNCRKFHKKIHESLNHAQIMRKLDNAKSFNINNEGLNDAMKETLTVLYPYTSYCEIYGHGNDPWSDYQAWLETKDFWAGVQLIEKHTRNRNLIRFFRKKGKSPRTQKILERNLLIISRKWRK
ncbi:MAG: glycosyltransferase domain-containing protein [Bacteroidales bacterium]